MQELLHELPGVIYEYILRKDGTRAFTYISDTCKDILGLTSEDLLRDSSRFRQIVYKDDLPGFEQSLQWSHENKSAWNWEGRIWRNDSVRWIETRSSALPRGDEVLRKGIIIDITDRKHEELRQELRYQALVESLPLGIGIHVNGKIVMANAYAHKLLRARSYELIDRSVMDIVHPDFRSLVIERMKRVMEGESVPVVEEQFVCLDGEVIDVETLALPFVYKGESAVQLIVRDITQEKRTKEEIKRNETFFTQLFDNVPMAVVMLDATGHVELVNRGFTQMFGYALNELKGKNLNDFIVPAELHNEGIDINNLIKSNRVIRIEAVRKSKDGRLVNVLLYGMPVWMEEKIIGIYGVYVDITERKRMEEELQIRNAELDNFVYKVSHDLRAPLSSILGLVNLSKFPGNPDSPYDYIRLIGEKASGLDHFISDVLSHSKNLKMEVSIEKVDLEGTIRKTIADLSYLEGADTVKFDIHADQTDFFSDPWRISEIFRNLVSNAIKYRQTEGIQPEVKVDIRIKDDVARITFSDNGIGIKPESLEKIFEMFYRATEQSDGSGIGLYIVKNAVEKLNGKVSVESVFGAGTTFRMQLPSQQR
jgi:PAS domain S-box-containing protein